MAFFSVRSFVAVLLVSFLGVQADNRPCKYRHGDTTVCTMLGMKWGWKGSKRLNQAQVDEFLVRYAGMEQNIEGKRYRQELKKVHPKRTKRSMATNDELEEKKTAAPVVDKPYMLYREDGGQLIGLVPCQNIWIFDVTWEDDPTSKPLAIENNTGETLFIDASVDPHHLIRARRLYGVRDGQMRLVMRPRRKCAIGLWCEQREHEKLRDLVTVARFLPSTTKLVVHRGSKGLRVEAVS